MVWECSEVENACMLPFLHCSAHPRFIPLTPCIHASTQGAAVPATFLHAAAEDTRLPDSSADLVSICLVCHELPRSATKEVTFA